MSSAAPPCTSKSMVLNALIVPRIAADGARATRPVLRRDRASIGGGRSGRAPPRGLERAASRAPCRRHPWRRQRPAARSSGNRTRDLVDKRVKGAVRRDHYGRGPWPGPQAHRRLRRSALASGALARPTMRGRRCVPPLVGSVPWCGWRMANVARSSASRKSHARASSSPQSWHEPGDSCNGGLGERCNRRHCAALRAIPCVLREAALNHHNAAALVIACGAYGVRPTPRGTAHVDPDDSRRKLRLLLSILHSAPIFPPPREECQTGPTAPLQWRAG